MVSLDGSVSIISAPLADDNIFSHIYILPHAHVTVGK